MPEGQEVSAPPQEFDFNSKLNTLKNPNSSQEVQQKARGEILTNLIPLIPKFVKKDEFRNAPLSNTISRSFQSLDSAIDSYDPTAIPEHDGKPLSFPEYATLLLDQELGIRDLPVDLDTSSLAQVYADSMVKAYSDFQKTRGRKPTNEEWTDLTRIYATDLEELTAPSEYKATHSSRPKGDEYVARGEMEKNAGLKIDLEEGLNALTEQERQIIALLDAGFSQTEIGKLLDLSGRKIGDIRFKIIRQLGRGRPEITQHGSQKHQDPASYRPEKLGERRSKALEDLPGAINSGSPTQASELTTPEAQLPPNESQDEIRREISKEKDRAYARKAQGYLKDLREKILEGKSEEEIAEFDQSTYGKLVSLCEIVAQTEGTIGYDRYSLPEKERFAGNLFNNDWAEAAQRNDFKDVYVFFEHKSPYIGISVKTNGEIWLEGFQLAIPEYSNYGRDRSTSIGIDPKTGKIIFPFPVPPETEKRFTDLVDVLHTYSLGYKSGSNPEFPSTQVSDLAKPA